MRLLDISGPRGMKIHRQSSIKHLFEERDDIEESGPTTEGQIYGFWVSEPAVKSPDKHLDHRVYEGEVAALGAVTVDRKWQST